MGSLAAIANGLSLNLIHRTADVMLKERKPLVLAVRETPLNRNHLENMLKAHDAGAVICPPMPAFYHKPETISDLAFHFAARLAAQIGITVPGMNRWQGLS
jgi:4-hydroxy-3-polyprenylbenzoate decarboxylase